MSLSNFGSDLEHIFDTKRS